MIWLFKLIVRCFHRKLKTADYVLAIKLVISFTKKNWTREYAGLLHGQKRHWQAGSVTIHHARYTRGDVIEVIYRNQVIAAWADQSHAYDDLMGLNDVVVKPEFTYVLMLDNLAQYKKEAS